MLKAFKYRLEPTKQQTEFFATTFGCVRKVDNLMLNDRTRIVPKESGNRREHQVPDAGAVQK